MSRSSKGRWVVLLTVMMVFGVAGNAAAHGTVDQSSESFDKKSCLTSHVMFLAQTFTPTADNLTGIGVHMSSVDPASKVELTIRTSATGAILARVEDIPLSVGWNHIDLDGPIDLTPGITYAIRLDWRGGESCWSVDLRNPYPGGWFWRPGGSDLSKDLNFRTWDEEGVPDNEPPVADPNGPYLVGAGASVAFDGTGSYDPDAGDSLAYSWVVDFGGFDDATAVQPTYNAPAAAGTYTVTLTVDDGNGGTHTESTTVKVGNRPPTITEPASDVIWDEGQTLAADGRFDDPDGDSLTVTADNMVGTFTATGGGGWTWTYPTTDNVIEHTINVTAEDGHGASATDSFDFSAANVPPDMGPITGAPVGPIPVGTTVTLAAAFTDPGTADTHEATWSWGDGSGPVTSPASSSILYDTAGVYSANVTVTVTDDDGGSDTETLELLAVVGDLEERKRAVLDDLFALDATGKSKKDDKKLEKAVEHLTKSLNPDYWVDGDTLVAKDGKKVFSEESKAVKDLEKIKSTDVSEAIASLVAIDKQLALGAIEDAWDAYYAVCSDPTTKECEKAAKELDKAAKELDKAQKELDKGHFAHAIGKYKKAWEKADKALRALPELDLGGDA